MAALLLIGQLILGYTAVRHRREVGTGYFDTILTAVSRGEASTTAIKGSTETEQFEPSTPIPKKPPPTPKVAFTP